MLIIKKLKLPQAFTLIELLAVMVIITIIAGLLVGAGGTARRQARERKAESMIASLEIAIGMYHTNTGVYPDDTSLATMISALKQDPGVNGWQGPYMDFKIEDYQNNNPATNIIEDPWGNAYYYDEGPTWGNTNSYNLWSCGPDGVDDSSDGDTNYGDDIHNW